MKASDLMIGNLIEYNGIICMVSEIVSPKPLADVRYSDKWIIELFDGSGLLSVPIEHTTPVILTEETLINFGFEKKQCGSRSYKYVKGIIEMHNYGGSTFKNMEIEMKGAFDAEDDEDIVNVMFPHDIIYAHDLQNIYKMFTREELIFKQ